MGSGQITSYSLHVLVNKHEEERGLELLLFRGGSGGWGRVGIHRKPKLVECKILSQGKSKQRALNKE